VDCVFVLFIRLADSMLDFAAKFGLPLLFYYYSLVVFLF
jgi:hypothetical protein